MYLEKLIDKIKMQKSKIRIFKILSNGTVIKISTASIAQTKFFVFYEQDYNNTDPFLKKKTISLNLNLSENIQYRRKYFK